MSEELLAALIAELRDVRPMPWDDDIADACDRAADRIEALQAEVERLTYDGIHTCYDDCPRLPCVQRREIDALQAQVAELESWKVAEEAHHHLLLAEVRRLSNELYDRKADVRHLMSQLQAHKDALAQIKGSSHD
jgi:Asp-tRNA(Asn)/Glu-tRNA(Gln) amidotransferase A subunit family amidase